MRQLIDPIVTQASNVQLAKQQHTSAFLIDHDNSLQRIAVIAERYLSVCIPWGILLYIESSPWAWCTHTLFLSAILKDRLLITPPKVTNAIHLCEPPSTHYFHNEDPTMHLMQTHIPAAADFLIINNKIIYVLLLIY